MSCAQWLLVLLQADAGAQVVQIFDSWASELAPQDFDIFSAPYIHRITQQARASQAAPCTTSTCDLDDMQDQAQAALLQVLCVCAAQCCFGHSSA